MIKLVILDFDDTICLTEEATFNLENDIAISMGYKPMSREVHQKNWGKPIREAIAERIPGIEVEEFLKQLEGQIPQYVQKGKLDIIKDANLATLDALRKKGKKIAVLTSRQLSEVTHLIYDGHPLRRRIDAFYHRDNSVYFKPNPKVFENILINFEVGPREAVYVGDSVSDAIATSQAGLIYINVLESGLRKKEEFKDVRVDWFVDKFTDILKIITSYT